jgi:hypothetical protein
MNLSEYFESNKGVGILATSDSSGLVDTAIYSRPHFLEGEGTLAFIMRDRLTHQNITSNPNACYMFIENGEGYKGVRIYLTKTKEEDDIEKIKSISRRDSKECSGNEDESRFLVYFQINKVRELIGDKIKE